MPIGLLTCITGVSGSGKSTLINETLYKLAAIEIYGSNLNAGDYESSCSGFDQFDKVIDINQSPIGRTPRSNPATYTGLFTPIRELFAGTQEARSRGYKPGRFSFNVKGGRCEACQGDGVTKVEMHFLPDVYVTCDMCKGKRYNRETLDITYKGKSIHQVLEMTVEDATTFFSAIPVIKRKLDTLMDVGLSYITLGQNATTLSGGEAQRIKLSRELSKRDTGSTLVYTRRADHRPALSRYRATARRAASPARPRQHHRRDRTQPARHQDRRLDHRSRPRGWRQGRRNHRRRHARAGRVGGAFLHRAIFETHSAKSRTSKGICMSKAITCFKAYDARGKVPNELNEEIAYRVGRAYAEFIKPEQVAVGRDVRLSSESLFAALCAGLTDSGVDVLDLGLCGTEHVYFAAFHLATRRRHHDYRQPQPGRLQRPQVCARMRQTAERRQRPGRYSPHCRGRILQPATRKGNVTPTDLSAAYIDHLLGYLGNPAALKPMKIVVNAGNGMAGPVIDLLENTCPSSSSRFIISPMATFPTAFPTRATRGPRRNHRCDRTSITVPISALPGTAISTAASCLTTTAALSRATTWSACSACNCCNRIPGERIVHDPRLTWNTIELIEDSGGEAVQSKSGHAFIKETMRAVNGIYGGEMSAHHYFREFGYCDSGMIPWLLVCEMICSQNRSLAEMLDERIARYPVSGEINTEVADTQLAISRVEAHFANLPHETDRCDGLGMDFGAWRFNLRGSNTEPLLRLNVESRADAELMARRRDEILDLISQPE